MDLGRNIETKEGKDFLQKELSRRLPKEDSLVIWRRLDKNVDTFLAVIWHKNWDRGRQGSQIYTAHEPVEEWTIETLRRIHHDQATLDLVHKDFELLTNDPDFSDSTPRPVSFKEEMQIMYNDLAIDDEGSPVYLSDGVWLYPDGTIDER